MISKFINRIEESNILENEWKKENSFVVVYGRRRIGKTELIKQFTRNKNALIYIFPETSKQVQLDEFKKTVADFLNDSFLKEVEIKDWYPVFDYLSGKIKEKTCIVLDEFTFGIKSDRKILSDLQRLWDTKFKNKKVMIILSGSLLGMMHEDVLSYASPLYGRRTKDLQVEELKYWHSNKFFNIDFEEFLKIYFVVGGIPEYLLVASNYKNFDDFVREEFINKKGYFYREPYFVLSQELREMKTYFSILLAMTFGNTKPTEIANYIGKNTREIYPYLENLIRLNFVRKEQSIVGKTSGLYFVNENFLDFWFNFVYRYREQIELQENINVDKKLFNTYFGKKFEQLSKYFLVKVKPFQFQKIGRWWHKDKEIDLVALNEELKQIAFFECKWKDLKEKQAKKILDELGEKSKSVDWNLDKRKEYFGLVGKKIEGKNKLRKEGFLVYDLKDF